jgi:hypothetical protein
MSHELYRAPVEAQRACDLTLQRTERVRDNKVENGLKARGTGCRCLRRLSPPRHLERLDDPQKVDPLSRRSTLVDLLEAVIHGQ